MRVRPGGSHHQKFVVLRHPGRPKRDVAFVGGIDLCHSRRDDATHAGDSQRQPMAEVYGERPPWHDAQVAIRGPAVGDVETVFRERWEDPAPPTRNPLHRLRDLLSRDDTRPAPLPAQLPDPAPVGTHTVQLLRTYPNRHPGYPFAPQGERSVARGYQKVLRRAERLVYIEDQYIWSSEVATWFAQALAARPELRLIAVIPRFPDQDGASSMPPNLIGRIQALKAMYDAGGDRVACYGIENHESIPVYVHAKICVVDDTWAAIGSANVNRRSWTHDSELACAVLDETPAQDAGNGARAYAGDLRLTLAREHLDRDPGDDADLRDPAEAFKAFREAAAALDAWHANGTKGPRPPGRLRTYPLPQLTRRQQMWAKPLYRTVYDPDGRPPAMRRRNAF
jgi:phosphatidylserine/phosphatidylglycerophosphate/cardiolipin synthase-like enzyme